MIFPDYLRDGRIKEELCTLVLLNDMASGLGVTLTDEERSACQAAAADYYGSLSDEEKSYVQSDESKQHLCMKNIVLHRRQLMSFAQA